MSSRGAIFLAVGMLILGVLIGLMSGGVAGFFIGQSSRVALGQNFQSLPQSRFTNPQQNATPQAPQGQQPQPQATPFSRRGNNGNGSGFPPAATVLNGARVDEVIANTPASKAGLQVGDIITAVGPTKLDANHTLADLIGTYKPGAKVDLSVTRGSQTMIVSVELGASSADSSKAYLGIQYSTMPGGQFRFPNG